MDDWHTDVLEEEERGAALAKAFTLVHEGPEYAVTQLQKQKQASLIEATERQLKLSAHPPLFSGEPEEARLARADASGACWASLEASIQETLDGTDADVFADLLAFAQQSHRAPAPDSARDTPVDYSAGGYTRLPTGLVLVGGVNSADHCSTFPHLAAFLRDQGCYVALLQPAKFGKAPGQAAGEVLRQFSGRPAAKAEHFGALVQWYRGQVGTAVGAKAGQASGRQQHPPAAAVEVEGVEADGPGFDGEEERDELSDAAGAAPAAAGDRRQLRQRTVAGGAAVAAASAAAAANGQRPLVVVVEGTEGVDVQCLRHFVFTASEMYPELPLTLMLGLTTSASALSAMLPTEATDRCMLLHHFKLAPAMTRLDSVVEQVLFGGSGRWPGLLFSRAIHSRLTDAFLNHYYTTGCIRRGLNVTALSHFELQPASALAAAALDGSREALEQACRALHPAVLSEARKVVGARSAPQLALFVWEAMLGWSRWAVGMQWLLAAGEATGWQGNASCRPWKLIEAGLMPDFAAEGGQLDELLRRVLPTLRGMQPPAVAALAARLRQRAAAVWQGEVAAAEELAALAAMAAEGGEQQEQEQPGQLQQEGADGANCGSAEEHGQQQQQQQQQDGEEQREQDEEQGPAKKKKKREVYHSKASRTQALVQKGAEKVVVKSGQAVAAAAAAQRSEQTPGARLATWLTRTLRSLLATPPTTLPGAAVFTCRDVSALDSLTAEPRAALHSALTEPHRHLPGLPEDMGACAGQEDAVLAYRLFDQDSNCANVADWFEAFRTVHFQSSGSDGADAADAGGTKRKRAALKKGKGKGGKAAADGAGGSADGAAAAEDRQAQLREIAARFSQATAELQYVGLIKPSRRRRGDFVQRVAHMPAQGCV